MSIITEVSEEMKNPLSIFESKTDEEENNISQKDINENNDIDNDNSSEKIRVNKELFAKIRKPNLPKKGVKRIVKADAVSFTLDKNKNKKVKRYFTSDFLSLNRRNKTPDKKVIEDLEKIKNKIKQKQEQKLKEKNLKKNRALHQKIMSDILTDKNKMKEKKNQELKKENDESNSETEDDEEQRRKMMKYGSIFEDLLKVNIKINQIIKKKKEKLENMNKSDGENNPYSYLYNSYGFPRTNASFMPDTYLKNLGNKKINKVKTSKAKIVNFYETVRAATSEYNFQKYRNSLTKSTKSKLNEDKAKDKKPKYKRKNCSSIDLDSYARKDKRYLGDKGYNKTIYNTNTNKSKKSNYPKEINNIKKTPKSFQLKTDKKMERVSTEQSSLNKRKVFDESFNKTNPKKSQAKIDTKMKNNNSKIDRYDDIDNSENQIVDDDNEKDNIKMSDLEEIKRNFKNKLISITNDLSDMKENEESSILLYYKGPIDIKNISLFNYKETVLNMKNQMSELGFEISKIKENIFKCSKHDEILIIQIVKIQSEMLYYLITKENKSNE